MNVRLTTAMRCAALIRRVNAEGGFATVLAKGDETSGAVLVLTVEKGAEPRFFERGMTGTGEMGLVESGPQEGDSAAATDYWQRRRRSDPDLWVIEVDIASAERFVVETIVPA